MMSRRISHSAGLWARKPPSICWSCFLSQTRRARTTHSSASEVKTLSREGLAPRVWSRSALNGPTGRNRKVVFDRREGQSTTPSLDKVEAAPSQSWERSRRVNGGGGEPKSRLNHDRILLEHCCGYPRSRTLTGRTQRAIHTTTAVSLLEFRHRDM